MPLGRCVTQSELRRLSIEEEIRQLENKKKRLIQEQKEQEREDRKNWRCKRMGFIEKLLPNTIPLTEEQFETVAERSRGTTLPPAPLGVIAPLFYQCTRTYRGASLGGW